MTATVGIHARFRRAGGEAEEHAHIHQPSTPEPSELASATHKCFGAPSWRMMFCLILSSSLAATLSRYLLGIYLVCPVSDPVCVAMPIYSEFCRLS
jgi:hypothetical protein